MIGLGLNPSLPVCLTLLTEKLDCVGSAVSGICHQQLSLCLKANGNMKNIFSIDHFLIHTGKNKQGTHLCNAGLTQGIFFLEHFRS